MMVPAHSTFALDVSTLLFVVATCVTMLMGLFLLFAWMQDRVRALAWWGSAYLVGQLLGSHLECGGHAFSPLAARVR